MFGKRKRPPEVFSGYESLNYHLTELELIIEAGTIQWSAETANAARDRLKNLATTIRRIITRIENE